MEYHVLIFMAKERLSALDIDTEGKADEISIDGNGIMTYASHDQIRVFVQHIKDYYNIDDFSELEMFISVLRFDIAMDDTFILLEEIKGVKECNLVSAEKLLPWIVLKEGLIKVGTAIQMRAFDIVYTVSLDNDMVLRCQAGGIDGHPFTFPKEKFAEYNHLVKNGLFSCEDELCKKYDRELNNKDLQIKKLKQQLLEETRKRKDAEDSLIKNTETIKEKEKNISRNICMLRCTEKEKDELFLKNDFQNDSSVTAINHVIYSLFKGEIEYFYSLKYYGHNTEIIKKGQKIAVVEVSVAYKEYESKIRRSNEDFVIKATVSGRLFWLEEEGTELKYGVDVAVIGDISDTREDVMRWYEKNRR